MRRCLECSFLSRTATFCAFLAAVVLHLPAPGTAAPADNAAAPVTVADRVEVAPEVDDEAIASRLTRILTAAEWFQDPAVHVEEGIVFLSGRTESQERKEWAGQIAAKTEDVVAVVNRIEVAGRPMWDLSPAWAEMRRLARQAIRQSPLVLLAIGLLVLSWFVAKFSARGADILFRPRLKNELLRTVAARLVAVPVFLLGLYLVLKVSGLTRLAVTVLGGTGLIGLVIGFAFRDIAENFLASILMSMRRPFNTGDLIEVAGYKGYVQQLNTRCTVLMTLEGNHVQIPNVTIYKDTITNVSANPFVRSDFTVGIGYADSIAEAQSVGLSVMRAHAAVLADPEPLVLVDSLGSATVNLRCFFWIDLRQHSAPKVRSAIIRRTKRAFQDAGISMPDDQREVVFPEAVPVRMLPAEETRRPEAPARPHEPRTASDDEETSNSAEGGLESEAEEIEQQARQSRLPESGRNLLEE